MYEHPSTGSSSSAGPSTTAFAPAAAESGGLAAVNPDEIDISDDFDDVPTTIDPTTENTIATTNNPDEITIDDDEFDEPESERKEEIVYKASGEEGQAAKDLQVDESADLVEQARKEGDEAAAEGVIGTTERVVLPDATTAISSGEGGSTTKFLALDKCGPGRDFIQVSTGAFAEEISG